MKINSMITKCLLACTTSIIFTTNVYAIPMTEHLTNMEKSYFIMRPIGFDFTEGDSSFPQNRQNWVSLPVYAGNNVWNVSTDIWNVEQKRIDNVTHKIVWLKMVWCSLTDYNGYDKSGCSLKVDLTMDKKFAVLSSRMYDKSGNCTKNFNVVNPIYYDIEKKSVFEALYDVYFEHELQEWYGDREVSDNYPNTYNVYGIKYMYRLFPATSK